MKRASSGVRGVFEKPLDSGCWWIRFQNQHGRMQVKKIGPKSTAEKAVEAARTKVRISDLLPEKPKRRLVGFAEIARDALEYSRRKKRTYDEDVSRMERILISFRDRSVDSITAQEIDKFLEQGEDEGWASSTVNHYRSLFSLTYRVAKKKGKVRDNPARDTEHRKEDNSRVRYLSEADDAELHKVIAKEWPEHLPEYIFAKNTGLRLGSQYDLTWDMVDWELRMLHIPRTKNEEPLHLPLNCEALAVLRHLRQQSDGTGWVFRSERHPDQQLKSNDHWFKPALRKAGVSNFRWHDLRHTFASRLRMKGTPLEDIADLLGHKSLAMTRRYAHLGPGRLHEVVARLNTNTVTKENEKSGDSSFNSCFGENSGTATGQPN